MAVDAPLWGSITRYPIEALPYALHCCLETEFKTLKSVGSFSNTFPRKLVVIMFTNKQTARDRWQIQALGPWSSSSAVVCALVVSIRSGPGRSGTGEAVVVFRTLHQKVLLLECITLEETTSSVLLRLFGRNLLILFLHISPAVCLAIDSLVDCCPCAGGFGTLLLLLLYSNGEILVCLGWWELQVLIISLIWVDWSGTGLIRAKKEQTTDLSGWENLINQRKHWTRFFLD